MPTRKKTTPEEAVTDLKARSHAISKSDAGTMIKKFKTQSGKVAKAAKSIELSTESSIVFPASLSYSKKAINTILSKKECIGLRLYPALTTENEFTIVIVGIDEYNNNMVPAEDAAPPEAKSVKKKAANIVAKPVAVGKGVLDEGQASPPYPAPVGGL